jgi:lysophospholipase L1-like esterase
MMKQLQRFLLAASVALVLPMTGCITPPSPSPKGDATRLQTAMAKLRRGETVSVVALGGSITTGFLARPADSMGWAGQVADWWEAKAKETGATLNYHNAGISGTDSAFASVRVQPHVLAFEPDVVFVEFAINDQWLDPKVRRRSYEGVLRQLLDSSPRALVLLALNERGGKDRGQRREQEAIGNHYGLPTLAWADWQDASVDKYYDGNESIHPNTAGHTNIAKGIIAYLDKMWEALPADDTIPPVETALPNPLVSSEFQKVQYLGWENAEEISNVGWNEGSDVHGEWKGAGGGAQEGWTANRSDAHLQIAVTGKSVGVLLAESDQYRNALAWIEYPDGKLSAKVPVNCFVSYRNGYLGWAYAEVADNLGSGRHILHITPAPGKQEGKTANIIGIICTE